MRHLLLFFLFIIFIWGNIAPCYAQENLEQLRVEAQSALAAGDYITAEYYFQRMLDSEEWEAYPDKINVLTQLGILEESQGRFEQAASYYERALERTPVNKNNSIALRMNYYAQRYAECLERAGYYQKAEKVYWDLYENAEKTNKVIMLRRLIDNYAFQQLTQEEIKQLKDIIIPQYQDLLGWELADLLRLQGEMKQSLELYELMWPRQISRAFKSVDAMAEVYKSLNQLDSLLERLQDRRKNSGSPYNFLLLEIKLLQSVGEHQKALDTLNGFLEADKFSTYEDKIAQLIGQAPIEVLDVWVDLVEELNSESEAIDMMKSVVKFLPLDVSRRDILGQMLYNAGRVDEAIQLWEEWVELQPKNPLATFKAAEKIHALGDEDKAKRILQSGQAERPPALAAREGDMALSLGLFDQAFAAFEIAVASGGVKPNAVTQLIERYADKNPDPKPLVGALIKKATGKTFTEVPEWIRTPLLDLGVKHHFKNELDSIARLDDSGLWKIHLARAAEKQGDRDWAVDLLQSVTEDSQYHNTAKRELAHILSEDQLIPSQREAAELLEPSLSMVLDTTRPVPLSTVLVDRLMNYADIQLQAFQPAKALTALHRIESSSPTLDRPLSKSEQDRLRFLRGKALLEFSSIEPAIHLLESIQYQPQLTEAKYLLARTYLAQNEVEKGMAYLREIVENRKYWQRANDALELLSAVEPLVGESLDLFCQAQLYMLQGRMEDAVPVLRQLAVNEYGNDSEEWARYTIGKMMQISGDRQSATDELKRLKIDVDHPVIQGMVELELLQLTQPADDTIGNMTRYQELLIDFSDTIFSDLARLEMQRSRTLEQ